jgi:hypothetical protein
MMKKTIVFGLLAIGAVLYFTPANEFSLNRVAKASTEKWTVRPLTPENEKIIQAKVSEPFHYIGRGAQAYVFFSKDGTTVLKLFKKKRFEIPAWMRLLPRLPYKTKKILSKRENLIKDFTSYQIAYNALQQQTGLLLVHLDSVPLHYTVTIIDQRQKPHQINLSDYAFILQKRGDLVYSTLDRYVKEENIDAAKESLTSLVHLLKERCDKGIADRDPNFRKNYAFMGTKAIEIDIGRFSVAPIHAPIIPKDFKAWLQTLSPELHSHFEKEYLSVFNPTLQQGIQEDDVLISDGGEKTTQQTQ